MRTTPGKTWGLDGNLFWFIVASVFLFVVTLLLLFSALRCSFGQSFSIALIPLALTLIYVFGLRQCKPPAYDLDLVDNWTNGAGFGPNATRGSAQLTAAERSLHSRRSGNPQLQPQHPLNAKSDVARLIRSSRSWQTATSCATHSTSLRAGSLDL